MVSIPPLCGSGTASIDAVTQPELAYVLSMNLSCRHLDESQRAMVAARLATLPHGGDRSKSSIDDLTTQAGASDLLNVGKSSVERARVVLNAGTPELIEAVEQGAINVSQGVKVARAPKNTQQRHQLRPCGKREAAYGRVREARRLGKDPL